MEVRRYLVEGLVQGVGFRNYTVKKAQGLGLSGWVRNLGDGRVEALAQGSSDQLREFEKYLRRGPDSARVEDVKVVPETLSSPLKDGFEVRWSRD